VPKKKVVAEAPARTVHLCGQEFEVAERVGSLPLMRFAKLARTGISSDDFEGMAAMYDLLKSCIADHEWDRFEAVADAERVDGDTLFAVVQDTFAVLAGRPTSRPSDSSDGPGGTSRSSTDASSSRAISRLEGKGRGDLALLVTQHVEAEAS
jgi:hypothetical protein